MSIVSEQHDLVKYDGKNKPLSGQQLITYTFRKVNEGSELAQAGIAVGTKPDNLCVSVPFITKEEIVTNLDSLLPAINELLVAGRKEILKDAFIGKKTSLSTADMGISAIISKLAESSSGEGRFSKAILKDWFETVAMPVLAIGVSAKLGITADTPEIDEKYKQLENTLTAVFEFLSSFIFAKKAILPDMIDKVEAILSKIKAGEDISSDDEILKEFESKLEVAKKKPAANLLDFL